MAFSVSNGSLGFTFKTQNSSFSVVLNSHITLPFEYCAVGDVWNEAVELYILEYFGNIQLATQMIRLVVLVSRCMGVYCSSSFHNVLR